MIYPVVNKIFSNYEKVGLELDKRSTHTGTKGEKDKGARAWHEEPKQEAQESTKEDSWES